MERVSIVKYRISDIEKIRSEFEKNHSEIINALNCIENELESMPTVLNTPNSSKIMSDYLNYLKKEEIKINEKDVYFKNIFKTIIDEYNQYVTDTKKSIEGNK